LRGSDRTVQPKGQGKVHSPLRGGVSPELELCGYSWCLTHRWL